VNERQITSKSHVVFSGEEATIASRGIRWPLAVLERAWPSARATLKSDTDLEGSLSAGVVPKRRFLRARDDEWVRERRAGDGNGLCIQKVSRDLKFQSNRGTIKNWEYLMSFNI
jgi:hypothetical protein